MSRSRPLLIASSPGRRRNNSSVLLIVWILLVGIFCTVECLVSMKSFLLRRSFSTSNSKRRSRLHLSFFDNTFASLRTSTTRTSSCLVAPFSGVAATQDSSQSYFERHSRLFSAPPSTFAGLDNMGDETKTDKKYTDYEKWVRRLYMTNLFHPVKMGLSNMQQLHDIMGNPMDDVSCI